MDLNDIYNKNIDELNWDKVVFSSDWNNLVDKSEGSKHVFEDKELLIGKNQELLAVYHPASDLLKTRHEICFKSNSNLFNTEASLL